MITVVCSSCLNNLAASKRGEYVFQERGHLVRIDGCEQASGDEDGSHHGEDIEQGIFHSGPVELFGHIHMYRRNFLEGFIDQKRADPVGVVGYDGMKRFFHDQVDHPEIALGRGPHQPQSFAVQPQLGSGCGKLEVDVVAGFVFGKGGAVR